MMFRAFLDQIERGVSHPSMAVLKLIARRTGKPRSQFMPSQSGATAHIFHRAAGI